MRWLLVVLLCSSCSYPEVRVSGHIKISGLLGYVAGVDLAWDIGLLNIEGHREGSGDSSVGEGEAPTPSELLEAEEGSYLGGDEGSDDFGREGPVGSDLLREGEGERPEGFGERILSAESSYYPSDP